MGAAENFFNIIERLYGDAFLAFFIFGGFYILTFGRTVLKQPSEDAVKEFVHNLFLNLFNAAMAAFLFGNLSFLSNFLFETLSLPHLTIEFWELIPNTLIFVFVLLVMDFQNYWAHRILHTKYLWCIHALHHSDAHMTWTTTYRIHLFEWVVMSFVYVALMGWLFLPTEIVVFVSIIRVWHSKLVHCQLGWTFGLFRKVIVSPNYHRWHHSISSEAHDKNFADMFPIWDIIFGTHHGPGLCDSKIGVKDMPKGFFQGQLYPFKYLYSAVKRRLPNGKAYSQQIP